MSSCFFSSRLNIRISLISESKNLRSTALPNDPVPPVIKRILSKGEICDLITTASSKPINWIIDDNERKEHYRTILSSSNRLEILNMIRELYIHKQEQLKNGKKMHLSDEQLMKEAERLLYSEFSLVLNIRADEVPKFISSRIN